MEIRVRAQVTVLGLQPGEEVVLNRNTCVDALIDRGLLMEVIVESAKAPRKKKKPKPEPEAEVVVPDEDVRTGGHGTPADPIHAETKTPDIPTEG